MTPDERSLLGRFLQDLSQSRGGLKDAEASDLIDRTVRSNPDAAYVLVQHAIIADQALHAAEARVSELEDQLRARAPGQGAPSGFLGGGGNAASAWGSPAPAQGYPQQPYEPQAYAAPPQRQGGVLGGLFGGGQPAQPGGFGSFLRNAGTAAAGVAGGEFLFHGLSNMFGGGRGYGGGFGGGFGGPSVENVTVNEYGDDGGMGGGYGDGGGGDFVDDALDDSGNY